MIEEIIEKIQKHPNLKHLDNLYQYDVAKLFTSFYKQLLEEDIKMMKELEVMGIGGNFGEGYEAGFKKAVSSLIDSKKQLLSITNIK